MSAVSGGGVQEPGVLLLRAIARRFRRARAWTAAGVAIAVAAVSIGMVVRWLPEWSGGTGSLAVLAASAALAVVALWMGVARPRPDELALAARHLDRVEPTAEESSALWLEEPTTALAALQRARTVRRLATRDPRSWVADPPWGAIGAVVVVGIALGFVVARWPIAAAGARGAASAPPVGEGLLGLRAVTTTVTPPSYLAAPPRATSSLGTTAEFGAQVEWRVELAGEPEAVALESAGRRWPFERVGEAWRLARRAETSEIVTLTARRAEQTWTSPAARLAVASDEPPEVRIVEPAAVVERRLADLGPLELRIEAVDDHAVANLELVLTLASGLGEGVSFEERRRPLGWTASPEGAGVRAATDLDLRSFGLGPGSELYLVAEARDRSPEDRRGRSEPVVVRVLAEGGESSGLGRGIVLRNELEALRSQRQVLMDTERLVAQASPTGSATRLSREEFERRAHAIGIDQRAVRLRYGELIGQEFEDGHAVEPEGGHAATALGSPTPNATPTSLADLVPEEMVHSHDSAEMATFFADPIRRQLRTMLAQMWESELRLRTFRPREALPFEREALRLLKILQESSRAYVPKFGSALPPFDERRRLSGDRSKAHDVRLRLPTPEASPSAGETWWIELSKPQGRLIGLAAYLEREAARGLLDDLLVLDAARRLEAAERTSTPRAAEDVARVAGGLWNLLPPPEPAPRSRLDGGPLLDRVAPRGGER